MYCTLCRNRAKKNTTFEILALIKSTINISALLYYVHMTTCNKSDEKCPRVTIIHFYILVWFNIRRHFCTTLYVRVSDSGQPVNCAIKYHTEITCHKLHTYTLARFTYHRTLLNNHMIQHTETFFAPACHLQQTISYDKNLSQSTQLNPWMLHPLSHISTYDTISTPDWINSKIDSIKSYIYLVESETSRFKTKFQVLLARKLWICYIATKGI